jgi:hypothetical protein
MMWLDELKPSESWMGVWRLKFTCRNCTCIIDSIHCSLCGYEHKPVQFPDATRGNINCATDKFKTLTVDLCIMYCVKMKATGKDICSSDNNAYLKLKKDKRYEDIGAGSCM